MRGWPPLKRDDRSVAFANAIRARSPSPSQVAGLHGLYATALLLGGRRFVPPGERPSTGVTTEMGRERPRPRPAAAAPRPFSGVAHAPHVGVGDVLGRVPDGR